MFSLDLGEIFLRGTKREAENFLLPNNEAHEEQDKHSAKEEEVRKRRR